VGGDNGQHSRVPWRSLQRVEVIALVVLNFAIFFHEESLPPLQHALFNLRYGAVPIAVIDAWDAFRAAGPSHDVILGLLPVITANYLHADIAHVGGNMLFLWVFANVLSHALGRSLTLLVYLLAGITAVVVHVHGSPTSEVPMIGASGAIAGLEGAYFVLVFRWELPHARVWPLEGPVPPIRLAVLAVLNFILDTGAFVGRSHDQVAHGAHLGGFLGGAFVAMVIASVWRPEWREP
jgi:membrane associated rhomboid family serine protease